MAHAILYAANTLSRPVAAGDQIDFGTVVRRFGKDVTMSGGTVETNASGYYKVDATFAISESTDATATITLYDNGTAIPGAFATATTVTGRIANMSISAVVRQKCCMGHTITAVLTGTDVTVEKSAIVVEQV